MCDNDTFGWRVAYLDKIDAAGRYRKGMAVTNAVHKATSVDAVYPYGQVVGTYNLDGITFCEGTYIGTFNIVDSSDNLKISSE